LSDKLYHLISLAVIVIGQLVFSLLWATTTSAQLEMQIKISVAFAARMERLEEISQNLARPDERIKNLEKSRQ
jgi:hypothetical protein